MIWKKINYNKISKTSGHYIYPMRQKINWCVVHALNLKTYYYTPVHEYRTNHRQQFERIWGNQKLTEISTRSQFDIIQGDGTPLSRGSIGRKTDLEGRYHSSSHYNDVIISAMASQITSFTIVYPTVYSGVDQGKHQSSASLAFAWGIHRWPVNSRHKGSVTRMLVNTGSGNGSARPLPNSMLTSFQSQRNYCTEILFEI